MNRTSAGFTLLELLIALAITALVATAAIAALNVFADADQNATRRMDESSASSRALQLLRRDVADAARVAVQANRVVVTRPDGSAIAWAVTVGGTELHRFTGTDATTATASADAAIAASVAAPRYSARGHLRDTDYRSTAVLQGAGRIQFAAVAPSSTTVGVQVTIQDGAGQATRGVALSTRLAEGQSKSAAIRANQAAGSSGSGSGSGSGGVVDEVVGGVGDTLGGLTGGLSQTTGGLLDALGGSTTSTGGSGSTTSTGGSGSTTGNGNGNGNGKKP